MLNSKPPIPRKFYKIKPIYVPISTKEIIGVINRLAISETRLKLLKLYTSKGNNNIFTLKYKAKEFNK